MRFRVLLAYVDLWAGTEQEGTESNVAPKKMQVLPKNMIAMRKLPANSSHGVLLAVMNTAPFALSSTSSRAPLQSVIYIILSHLASYFSSVQA